MESSAGNQPKASAHFSLSTRNICTTAIISFRDRDRSQNASKAELRPSRWKAHGPRHASWRRRLPCSPLWNRLSSSEAEVEYLMQKVDQVLQWRRLKAKMKKKKPFRTRKENLLFRTKRKKERNQNMKFLKRKATFHSRSNVEHQQILQVRNLDKKLKIMLLTKQINFFLEK